jgi:spermidine synthase
MYKIVKDKNGITQLLHGESEIMTDREDIACHYKDFFDNAKGDIFIAGLGMGFMIDNLKDDQFDTIDIVEKNLDLINFIKDKYKNNNKINIIHADIFKYNTNNKYDVIYFDVWNSLNHELKTKQFEQLKIKFNKNLKVNSYISGWGLKR